MDPSLGRLLNQLTRLGVRLQAHGTRLVCNAPPDALTPDLQAEIGRQKPQLLALLGAQSDRHLRGPVLKRRSPDAPPAPVSFGQERLWLLQAMNPRSFGYNIPSAIRLHGPLNIEALESALSEIVRRHEILRTILSLRDGKLVQVVHAPVRVSLPPTPFFARAAEDIDRQLHEDVTQLAQQPFDLASFPYWAFSLLRIGPEDHVLVTIQHHIVSDGWSIGILLHELSVLYQAFSDHQASPLPELPIQYGDYAQWQRRRLDGENLQSLLSWWKQHLDGAPRTLELPTDHVRPTLQSERGDWEMLSVGPSYCRKIREFCGRHSVTPFMLLLSVFSVLLSRYCRQRDLVIGTPVGNRDHPLCENLLGFFLNTLAVRIQLDDDPPFAQLVQRVRATSLDVFSHQELPFEKLVEALAPDRDLSRSPIFQVMFIMHNQSAGDYELRDLTLGEVQFESGTAKYDLTLAARLFDDSLLMTLEYCTALFQPATVRRMLRNVKELLASALDNPNLPVSELALVPPEEVSIVLSRWNETSAEYPSSHTIDELVFAQALRTPDRFAVTDGKAQLTYREFWARVEDLQKALIDHGLRTHDHVAIYCDRTTDMLAGLLAVLRMGAVFVPFDDALPRDRMKFIVRDASIAAILTSESKRQFAQSLGVPVISIDTSTHARGVQDTPMRTSRFPERRSAMADHCAYIIYTSGSTGQPKGVAVTHRAVVNFLASMAKTPGLGQDDRVLALTSLTFDIAVLELLLPLTTGAMVILADTDAAKDGRVIDDLLRDQRVTVMQATPTGWMLLLQSGWVGKRDIVALCGGEPLSRHLAKEIRPRVRELWNMYGPTETTVWSSLSLIQSTETTPAIGRPIANTQLYVLDEHLDPVPIGAVGVLFIAGDGLAVGYINRSALTAACFLPNPFSETPGARMYSTGDLVRYLGSGQLQFVHRVDRQVKVRGHRIEPEEIERALMQDDMVSYAVVNVAEEEANGALIAWIVPENSHHPKVDSIRQRLTESLPSYMIPNRLIVVETLPTTPSGKLDLRELPQDGPRSVMEQQFVAPVRPLEERIAGIWRHVLHVNQVGIDDNFFDLGGHSLLLASVRQELSREFERELSMVDLFRHPTIRSLARYLEPNREITSKSVD